MARLRSPDTIEVPVGLLHAFSEKVSQYEGLYHDLECLVRANGKYEGSSAFWDNQHSGNIDSHKQDAPGPDQLSSAFSSSGGSTTDEVGGLWSLESVSTPEW